MPLFNFDLLDGKLPVTISLSKEDSQRMIDFMAECTAAIQDNQQFKNEVKSLIEQHDANDWIVSSDLDGLRRLLLPNMYHKNISQSEQANG